MWELGRPPVQKNYESVPHNINHITMLVQWQRRYTWHQSIYVIFSLISHLQILLISNLPVAKLATFSPGARGTFIVKLVDTPCYHWLPS